MKSLVNEGFILYLDDDDELAHDLSLYTINKHLENDNILVWKFFRSDKLIYPKNLSKIALGEIVSLARLTQHFNLLCDKRNGDYNIFANCYQKNLCNIADYIKQNHLFKYIIMVIK